MTRWRSACLVVAIAALCVTALTAQQKARSGASSAEALLGQALHELEVEGDLQRAAATLKKVLADPQAPRDLRAKAQAQLTKIAPQLTDGHGRVRRSSVTARRVLDNAATDPYHSLSADGKLMAMTDWSTGDLAIRDLSTGTVKPLLANGGSTSFDEFGYWPVLSPDTKSLVSLWYTDKGIAELRLYPNQLRPTPRILISSPEVPYLEPAGWAPDGRAVLTVLWRPDDTTELAWVSVSSGEITRLKFLEWRRPGRPQVSPDGRFVVYSARPSSDATETHLYVLRSDGGGEATLMSGPGLHEAPVWTPDGQHVVFTSNRGGSFGLWAVAVKEGKPVGPPVALRPDTGRVRTVAVTSDWSLYYVHRQGGENVMQVAVRRDGVIDAQPQLLVESHVGSNRAPSWSPDGNWVAFRRKSQTNINGYDLVVRRTSGEEERTFTSWLIGTPAPPAWFSDSKAVLVSMRDRQNRMVFYRVETATGEWSQVTAPGDYSQMAALGPDDRTLFVLSRAGDRGKRRVAAINLTTGAQRDVFVINDPDAGPIDGVSVSPDGRTLALKLLYFRKEGDKEVGVGHIAVIDVDGRNLRYLYSPHVSALAAAATITFSRDGKAVYFGESTALGGHAWKIGRVPVAGGAPTFASFAGAGLRHALSFNQDGTGLVFGSGAQATHEVWALDNALAQVRGQ